MSRILRGEQWGETLRGALGNPPEDACLWMERETRIVKSDRYSRVGLLQLRGRPCYLKLYRPKGVLQQLQFRLGKGRGVASFDNAARLRDAGLAVPEALTCVLAGGGLLLLTEGIEQSQDLKNLWSGGLADEQIQPLMGRAAAALAAWHSAGFCHGDSKWSNFLVAADEIYLVDLEAVARGKLEGRGCTRDLARFTVNAEDMGLSAQHYRGFLQGYTNALGLSPEPVVQRILPQVQGLRRRHLKKYGERGHPLV